MSSCRRSVARRRCRVLSSRYHPTVGTRCQRHRRCWDPKAPGASACCPARTAAQSTSSCRQVRWAHPADRGCPPTPSSRGYSRHRWARQSQHPGRQRWSACPRHSWRRTPHQRARRCPARRACRGCRRCWGRCSARGSCHSRPCHPARTPRPCRPAPQRRAGCLD